MTLEQLTLDKLADDIAKIAAEDVQLLIGGDPSRIVASALDGVEHGHMIQVTSLLWQRFASTVVGKLPTLEPLAAAATQTAIPTLARLHKCTVGRQAFQAAFALAPLLCRTVAVAAQCCALAMRNISDLDAVLTLTRLSEAIFKVLGEAVADRIERFRPLESGMVSAIYQVYSMQQVELATALKAAGVGDVDADADATSRVTLVHLPERQSHKWRNDELRQFWAAKCAPRYEDTVPLDALGLLLLRAATAETSLPHREAVMRRLSSISERKDRAGVNAAELDGACAQEIRRTGGLKAWINALVLPGGVDAAGPGPFAAPKLKLTSTMGSVTTAATWPQSARSTGASLFSARGERLKPFALSASGAAVWKRPVQDDALAPHAHMFEDGAASNADYVASGGLGYGDRHGKVNDSIERGLFRTSQRLIMAHKLGVNSQQGTWRETPLHHAAVQDKGHAPATCLLLERGADVNAEDKHLATPLHVAASTGHGEVARRLVRCGADVCKEDRWQATPLHKAADNGRLEVVELLLQNGAEVCASDVWGQTPLHRAAARGQLAVAEKVLVGGAAPVDAEDSAGRRPLHMAASSGNYAIVKLLLENGAVALARSRVAGKTAEDFAREHGHTDVVTLLQNRAEWITPRVQSVVFAA